MRPGPQEVKIAYKVPGQKDYLMLEVRYSANAWWMEKEKVYALLRVFRNLGTLREACFEAGITLRQYRYFAELHPIIEDRRRYPHAVIGMKAKTAIAKKIQEGDLKTCKQWLEMTEPETYSLRHHRSAYGNLRRRLGLHAKTLPPIDYKKEYERIRNDLEELRKDLNLFP